jgi:6-pyruvoyltetrahydropterin/6-carboxytetrahydropterin synthase
MFELSVTGNIASAHFLPGYEGPCRNLHGHTWKIEVSVCSEKLDKIGLVVDFKLIKNKLNAFLSHIDHVCLNDLDYFKKHAPTTENIARYIYQHFAGEVAPLKIGKVRVWESETSSITYYE